jgi:hypothetical protein
MRCRILGALSALTIVVAGVIGLTAQQGGASQEFTLVAHQTNFEYVPVGGPATANLSAATAPPSIGDETIMRESLMSGDVTVGYDNIVCTETFNYNALCDAVLSLTGQGDIHATALVRDAFDPNTNGPSVFDATIDGGTFAYADARGMVHLTSLPDGDTDDSFIIN